ncbi:MAG: HDIG domain-containing protein, partial [Candidatus Aerophobetes bacterium]|nr:HDIG domain-containing protein [Candidatus Aerophobetes bacterium]
LCAVVGMGLFNHHPLSQVGSSGLWGMGNGFFSSILAMGILPYLETYFSITTDIKLVELTNLNLPLLKRLSIEAPGTYHHSMTVANLAESGAEAIEVNPLLARVGAYYHDIGKVIRPYFFFENYGASKENYHEKITPNLSSTIIISHIKDGIGLAQQSRLPQVVIDIIAQHHGNGLIAHFYREALLKMSKEGKKESIGEESFRYPGPKPQTKGAAVVMLADSVEAAFRFSPQTTPKGITAQVKKVINNKLKDNQLDECDLTLKDTAKIIEAFARVLSSAVHTRGRYPAEMVK